MFSPPKLRLVFLLLSIATMLVSVVFAQQSSVPPETLIEMIRAGDFAEQGIPANIVLCQHPVQRRRRFIYRLIRAGQATGAVNISNEDKTAFQEYFIQLQDALIAECS